jgi:DNA-directed RNA polymerase specialized sigma24 family protein
MCALARLPGDYREVLRRVYLNGEPFSVVATDMRRTEDAVRRLAGRALERLRHEIEITHA